MVMKINRESDAQVDLHQRRSSGSGNAIPATSPAASEIYRDEKKRAQFNAYLTRYQFERDPFSDQDNSGLFYPGSGRQQAVQSLLHYSRYGSTPVFLTGPSGAGKTATLSAAVRELKGDVDIASIRAELMMTTAQVFTRLAAGLGIDIDNDNMINVELLGQSLLAFFESNTAIERQSLICIDNIEDLGHEALASVFTLIAAAEGQLAAILVGQQPALSLLDAAAETHNLLINRIELTPFNQSEVYEYVLYRLEAVGFKHDFPLSQMQLQALTYRSQGSVRQLHQVVRSMLMAGKDNQPVSRKPFPLGHAIVLILLTAVIVFTYNSEVDKPLPFSVEPIVLVGSSDITIKEANSGAIPRDDQGQIAVGNSPSSSKTADSVRASLDALTQGIPIMAEPPINAQNGAVNEKPPTADLTPSGERLSEDIRLERAKGNAEGKVLTNNSDRFEATSKRLTIADWPDTGYALQIFGTHNLKRAVQLVEEYAEQLPLVVYETRYSDKPWFVVVSGPYLGRDEAKQAIETLSGGLQRLRPWPRNIASIQSDMQRFSAVINAERE